jgi:hypothetical protein
MKNLDEKKLLVKMARMLGQPVDQELLESIEKEERLNKVLFKEEAPAPVAIFEEKKPEPQVLVEAPPKPEPVFEPPFPTKKDMVNQVANVLKSASPPPPNNPVRDKELDTIRKTLAEMMQKIATMSWGGGGTGVVRIGATDDFDKDSYGEGRYLRWKQGMFRLDDITSGDVQNSTTLVEENEYYILDDDWYIGVNYAGTVNIYLPITAPNGRNLVIKDESGNCANNPIIATGTVDNDAGGFNLQINNGAIHMVYRNGWRII